MIEYLKEVRKEVSKVVWPEPKEALALTAGVIVLAAIVSGAFAVLDMGVLEALKALIGG